MRAYALAAAAAIALAAIAAGCGGGGVTTRSAVVPAGASAGHGRRLIEYYGCGSCHMIGGIATANGQVGPSLEHFFDRQSIAGRLPNTTAALEEWIQHPQQISPGTIMPDLGVTAAQARDIAAYLDGQ